MVFDSRPAFLPVTYLARLAGCSVVVFCFPVNMSKRNRVEMDSFSPAAQPDEGYSEDPLNPPASNALHGSLSTLRSPADLPGWIAANGNQIPVSMKRGQ